MILWLLLLAAAHAAPPREAENVYVGQVYNRTSQLTPAQAQKLPSWLIFEKDSVVGIPSKSDLGRHTVQTKDGSLTIVVREDDVNPCGEEDTTWVEVVYAQDAKMSKKVKAAKEVATVLGTPVADLRLFSYEYSRNIRGKLEMIGGDEPGAFVILKASCDGGEVGIGMDLATDDMDKLLEDDESDSGYAVTISKGQMQPRKQREQGEDVIPALEYSTDSPSQGNDEVFAPVSTSTSSTTSQRTTRQASSSSDRPPIRINSMAGFTCVEGVYCDSLVPQGTFKDVEDGDTYQLKLEITLTEGPTKNFLFYEDKKLHGVPMAHGEYHYRLDARDKRGQMTSAPFSVTVKPSSPANHVVTFDLDLKSTQDLSANPQLLAAFVRQLATVTKSSNKDVSIREITKEAGKTIVRWSNNTLPYKTCSEAGLESMRHTMLTKQRKQMNRQFERAMTDRFNLRKVHIEPTENCLADGVDTATTVPSVEAAQDAAFPWLILLAVLAIFILLAVVIFCCCSKNKGKKDKPSEYTGKGLPVVFPEEVGEDHELAHAATPMLTKEERPPLKVSQHENPLYKPPPPLAVSSPRIGSTTASAPNQRMPPPYVPP